MSALIKAHRQFESIQRVIKVYDNIAEKAANEIGRFLTMMYSNITILTTLILISPNIFSMMRALNTAASGMASQEMTVNTISNNIANINTNGYKKQRTETESLIYQTILKAGSRSSYNSRYSVGIQLGSGL